MFSSSAVSVCSNPVLELTVNVPLPHCDITAEVLASSSTAVPAPAKPAPTPPGQPPLPPTITTPRLNPKHLAEFRASGISDEIIARCGARSARGDEIHHKLGWSGHPQNVSDGWVIPYGDPRDRNCLWRAKLDRPRLNADGDPIKYEQPIGIPCRAYMPPGIDLEDLEQPLLITEGEKKALSAASFGFNCIAIPGVWNWQEKRPRDERGKPSGRRQLISDLSQIAWKGRRVYIVFDSDVATKPQVQSAERELASTLAKRGAEVRVVRLPKARDGSKHGLDDYLVANGVEKLRNLLVAAKRVKRPRMFPLDYARLWIEMDFKDGDVGRIRCWRGELYLYNHTHYRKPTTGNADFEMIALMFLDRIGAKATPRLAASVVKALMAETRIPDDTEPPFWIQRQASGAIVITSADCPRVSFTNGTLSLTDDFVAAHDQYELRTVDEGLVLERVLPDVASVLRPHSPTWLNLSSLDFPFDPKATCPQWEAFLKSVIDAESVELLQRWFGYLISERTDLQQMLWLIGVPRSGKGVITRMATRIMGVDAVATPSLSELAGAFGLWPLTGKKLAVLADAHVVGRDVSALEKLKAISGEDRIDVARKCLSSLCGVRLPVRFVLAANELPAMIDPSAALATRISLIRFSNSFVGREDRTLDNRLAQEAPGVFNWAVRGLQKLCIHGMFNEPQSSRDLMGVFREQAAPISVFLAECCTLRPNLTCLTHAAFHAYSVWAAEGGRGSASAETVGRRFFAAIPGLKRKRASGFGNYRPWAYVGFELNVAGQDYANRWQPPSGKKK